MRLIAEILEQRQLVRRLKQKVVAKDAGPMYWLRSFTKTENYHWMAQGREPLAPFPYRPLPQQEQDYLDIVMSYLLHSAESGEPLFIPKTREMMTSWLVVGYITWFCQFYPQIEWLGQSEKDDKAQGLIKYANILYRNQPEWLKRMFPLKNAEDQGTLHKIEWAHGSGFTGVPQGERQLASAHPFGYFNDESAHQEQAGACFDFAKPAVKQIVFVSSAAPGWFGDQSAK